jgi:hypothetical protein
MPRGATLFAAVIAAWRALLPSVDVKKEELAASRSKQRTREASSACAVVSLLAGGALICNAVGVMEVEYTTSFANVAAMFETVVVFLWMGALIYAPRRFWLHLCVLTHVWATVIGVAMVVIMSLDGCDDNTPEKIGLFSLAERVCRYTRVGIYPSWVSIFVLMPTFVVVILDRLSFRMNLAVLLTQYTLYSTATYGMLAAADPFGMLSSKPSHLTFVAAPTVATYAGHIWIDFLVSTPILNLTPAPPPAPSRIV